MSKDEIKETPIQYTIMLGGSQPYLKDAIETIYSNLQPVIESQGWEQSSEEMETQPALFVDRELKAHGTIVTSLVYGAIFIASWAGNKVLDQFFTDELQKISNKVASILLKRFNLKAHKLIEVRHIVWYKDIELAVVIRMKVNNEKQIKENSNALIQAHRNASSWFKANGKQAPVHCYIIENGKSNIEPILYQSIQEMDDIEGRANFEKRVKEFREKNNKT